MKFNDNLKKFFITNRSDPFSIIIIGSSLGVISGVMPAVVSEAVYQIYRGEVVIAYQSIAITWLLFALNIAITYYQFFVYIKGQQLEISILRSRLGMYHLLAPIGYHFKDDISDIFVRSDSDITTYQNLITEYLIYISSTVISLLIALYFSFRLNYIYGVVVMVIFMTSTYLFRTYTAKLRKDYVKVYGDIAKNSSFLSEYLSKIQIYRSSGIVNITEKLFFLRSEMIRKSLLKLITLQAPMNGFLNLITGVLVAVALFFGLIFIFKKIWDVSSLTQALLYAQRIAASVIGIGMAINFMRKANISIERITEPIETLALEQEITNPSTIRDDTNQIDDIYLEKVKLKPGALYIINPYVHAENEKICLSLLGIEQFKNYHFEISGLPHKNLTDSIGYMSSTGSIIDGSLEFNIVTEDHYDKSRLLDLYSTLRLHKEIGNYESAKWANVSTLANNLSGGQVKRVSLIRNLLSNKRILILDEPLRGLDSELFDAVINNISIAANDRIIIIVSSNLDHIKLISSSALKHVVLGENSYEVR